ncbi:HNH endonuclease [Micromonospora tulbaghiae]|uniref:HNH endonuclease n=1 Tax=Micromonospora tulbaghiae TaxID=479978 RepID=UPI003432DA4D
MVNETPEPVQQAIVEAYQAGTTHVLIAAQLGVTTRTVLNILERRGVPRRRRPGAKRQEFNNDELQRMAELRRAGMSKDELRDEFNCGSVRLARALQQLGLADRMRRRDAKDRVINQQGYAYVAVADDDPLIVMTGRRDRYVLEHRLVMARALGRPLRADETVHHLNGDRTDNRLENLQLRQGKHGKGASFACADCGSHNLVPVELH